MRFLFGVPPVSRPIGGVNVIMEMIAALKDAGHDARPLYSSRDEVYEHARVPPAQGLYDPQLEPVFAEQGRRARLAWRAARLRLAFSPAAPSSRNARLRLRPDDVIVASDWALGRLAPLYPRHPKVALVQGLTPLYRGFDPESGAAAHSIAATVATSQACAVAARLSNLPEPAVVRLSVGQPGLGYREGKKRQVAYVPGKLPHFARVAVAALRRAPELAGYDFVPIQNRSGGEVAQILNDSLIFLSVVDVEGFGLPAAEAMRAGCIVVGFTGIGGREFFSQETGVPVADGDVAALVQAAQAVSSEYDSDRSRLDDLRRAAAHFVTTTYSDEAFRLDVCKAFEESAARIRRGR